MCSKPTELTATEITANSVKLSWTENGEATAWEIQYSTDADNIDEGTTILVTENPYTLTGLTAQTTYYARVRAVCGEGDYSNWNPTATFTTAEPVKYKITIERTPNDYDFPFIFPSLTPSAEGNYYAPGTQVRVDIPDPNRMGTLASPGAYFAFLFVDGVKVDVIEEDHLLVGKRKYYTFTMPEADVIIVVEYTIRDMYHITKSCDPADCGTISGPSWSRSGRTVTLTATPNEGYAFKGWYNGTALVSPDTPYTFTPTGDVTLTAVFAKLYPLWIGDTQVDETNKDDIPGVTGENAKASFDPATNTLTLENVTGVTGSTMGSLITAEGIDLTIKGSAVLADASTDMGIQVAPGSLILDGDFTFSAGSYGIYVHKDVTVAKGSLFAEGWAYGVYSARGGIKVNGGELEALGSMAALGTDPDLSGYAPEPVVVVNTDAVADDAAAWNGTDPLGGSGSPYKYVKVSPPPITITITPVEGGTATISVRKPGQFSPQAAQNAAAGDEVTVSVTPNEGYGISSVKAVTANGVELSLSNYAGGSVIVPVNPGNPWDPSINNPKTNYTFTMPEETVNVTVRFAVTYPITLTVTSNTLLATADAPSSGAEGETITVRLKRVDQHVNAHLKSVVVTGADGSDIPATKAGENFIFTMPAQAVEVAAEVAAPPCRLTSITTDGATLVPAFDPEVTAYTITVPYETEEIGLAAEDHDNLVINQNEWKPGSLQLTMNPNHSDAIIKADGRIALDVGENVVHLTASYTNGFFENTEYTVTIVRRPQGENAHIVTFRDGETILSNATVNNGEKVARPTPDPKKDGYTFGGWYADPDFETPFDFDQEITESIRIYAKFTLLTYSITIVNDPAEGGTAKATLSGQYLSESLTEAPAGKHIQITPKAASGYQVKDISYQTESGTEVTVELQSGGGSLTANGSGIFVMPAEAVTVTVSYAWVYPNTIVFRDNGDNSDVIDENAGQTKSVIIYGRTLYRDGRWNTLCLPFSVENFTGTPLEGATVKRLGESSYDAPTKTLTLNFEDASVVKVGVPYIVRWTEGENIVNPVFSGVEILSGDVTADATDCADFIGCYSPVTLAAQDRTVLYLGGDSKLYYPSVDVPVNAFRGYFQLKDGLKAGDLPANGAKNIVLNFGNGETTGVSAVESGELTTDSWYSIDGRRLQGEPAKKGIYIKNGKKVIK